MIFNHNLNLCVNTFLKIPSLPSIDDSPLSDTIPDVVLDDVDDNPEILCSTPDEQEGI